MLVARPVGESALMQAGEQLQGGDTVAARVVTLDEAIGIALRNHPRLKTAEAAVDRSRAARGEAWEMAPASFSYSWGQLNGEYRHDNQLEVTQPLGSHVDRPL